jgi:hypothetical protein
MTEERSAVRHGELFRRGNDLYMYTEHEATAIEYETGTLMVCLSDPGIAPEHVLRGEPPTSPESLEEMGFESIGLMIHQMADVHNLSSGR